MDLFTIVSENILLSLVFIAIFVLLSIKALTIKENSSTPTKLIIKYSTIFLGFIFLFNTYFYLAIPKQEKKIKRDKLEIIYQKEPIVDTFKKKLKSTEEKKKEVPKVAKEKVKIVTKPIVEKETKKESVRKVVKKKIDEKKEEGTFILLQ